MLKPKIEDFNLKSAKLLNNGAMEVKWNYMYSLHNEAHQDNPQIKRTLPIHEDLLKILKKQKSVILKVEEINYKMFSTLSKKLGINKEKEINQIADSMTNEALMKIEPTGFAISGKDENTKVQITYKKITGNKQIAGRCTTHIALSGNIYGIEDELTEDIDNFTDEVYKYLYENKHNESDQLEFGFFKDHIDQVDQEPEEKDEKQ